MNAKFQRPRPVDAAMQTARIQPEFVATEPQVRTVEKTQCGIWRWADLMLSLLFAVLLCGSWLWPKSRVVWNQVDATMFRFFNGALSFEWWREAWAWMNHDYFDFAGLVLYGALLCYAARYGRHSFKRNVISVALLAVVLISVRFGTSLTLKYSSGALWRPSPTLVNDDALRLSSLVPDVEVKDESPFCFPSDHGLVVLGILLYLGYQGPNRAVTLGVLLAVMFSVPRLVAGAHWFTDLAVGSAVLALVSTGFLMATPLHDWALSRIDSGGTVLRRRLVRSA